MNYFGYFEPKSCAETYELLSGHETGKVLGGMLSLLSRSQRSFFIHEEVKNRLQGLPKEKSFREYYHPKTLKAPKGMAGQRLDLATSLREKEWQTGTDIVAIMPTEEYEFWGDKVFSARWMVRRLREIPMVCFRTRGHVEATQREYECDRTRFGIRVFGRTDDMMIVRRLNVSVAKVKVGDRDTVPSLVSMTTGAIKIQLYSPLSEG